MRYNIREIMKLAHYNYAAELARVAAVKNGGGRWYGVINDFAHHLRRAWRLAREEMRDSKMGFTYYGIGRGERRPDA